MAEVSSHDGSKTGNPKEGPVGIGNLGFHPPETEILGNREVVKKYAQKNFSKGASSMKKEKDGDSDFKAHKEEAMKHHSAKSMKHKKDGAKKYFGAKK